MNELPTSGVELPKFFIKSLIMSQILQQLSRSGSGIDEEVMSAPSS
jgi:hypothetical protein